MSGNESLAVSDSPYTPTLVDSDHSHAPTVLTAESDGAYTPTFILPESDQETLADTIIDDDDEPNQIGESRPSLQCQRHLIQAFRQRCEDDGIAGLQEWCVVMPVLRDVWLEARRDPRIVFNFTGSTVFYDQLDHAIDIIEERLSLGYIAAFKIGITFIPLHRYTNDEYGYCHEGFEEFIVIGCSSSSRVIAQLEIELISQYRRHDRSGNYVGGGHPLCINRAGGGESAHHGEPPFFVYLVVKPT